jgi:hypothetical protein
VFLNDLWLLCTWAQDGLQEVFGKGWAVKLGMLLIEIVIVGIMFCLFDWEEYQERTWRTMSQEALQVGFICPAQDLLRGNANEAILVLLT